MVGGGVMGEWTWMGGGAVGEMDNSGRSSAKVNSDVRRRWEGGTMVGEGEVGGWDNGGGEDRWEGGRGRKEQW
jgi:hypothetical protein